jgi:hypothetical protein
VSFFMGARGWRWTQCATNRSIAPQHPHDSTLCLQGCGDLVARAGLQVIAQPCRQELRHENRCFAVCVAVVVGMNQYIVAAAASLSIAFAVVLGFVIVASYRAQRKLEKSAQNIGW